MFTSNSTRNNFLFKVEFGGGYDTPLFNIKSREIILASNFERCSSDIQSLHISRSGNSGVLLVPSERYIHLGGYRVDVREDVGADDFTSFTRYRDWEISAPYDYRNLHPDINYPVVIRDSADNQAEVRYCLTSANRIPEVLGNWPNLEFVDRETEIFSIDGISQTLSIPVYSEWGKFRGIERFLSNFRIDGRWYCHRRSYTGRCPMYDLPVMQSADQTGHRAGLTEYEGKFFLCKFGFIYRWFGSDPRLDKAGTEFRLANNFLLRNGVVRKVYPNKGVYAFAEIPVLAEYQLFEPDGDLPFVEYEQEIDLLEWNSKPLEEWEAILHAKAKEKAKKEWEIQNYHLQERENRDVLEYCRLNSSVEITSADSLAAGNCEVGTKAFMRRFHLRDKMTLGELRDLPHWKSMIVNKDFLKVLKYVIIKNKPVSQEVEYW